MNKPTVTFFSNFLLHHQTPFCEAMVERLGGGFRFVATEKVPEERLNMGYRNYENEPYAVNSYKDEKSYNEALRLGYESDVVIIGSAPDEFIEKRLAGNKLTFRYCERFFMVGRWRILVPRVLRARYLNDIRYRNKNLYMLCASAYTAPDCRFLRAYPGKTYKWGYFPEVKALDNIENLIDNKKKNTILWAGRFIGWKHPEKAVALAEYLRSKGVDFSLTIIGTGSMEQELRRMIAEKKLENHVTMPGAMPPEKVREYMEKSQVYLFTSDRNEGWGAVLNESLNSACAVVACKDIGSVPYMLKDGENGLVFENNNIKSMFTGVERLLEDNALRRKLQLNAYETTQSVWNAQNASDRLLHLIECIQKGREVEYTSGPCSRD